MQHVQHSQAGPLPPQPSPAPDTARGADLLREIVEHTGEVAYRYRLWPTCGYDYVSDSVVHVLGYTASEMYAEPALTAQLVYPDDAQLMQSVLDAPGGQELELSLRWLSRNGRIVSTEVRCVLIRDASGRPLYVDGVLRNVTAREDDRQRLQFMQRRRGTRNGGNGTRLPACSSSTTTS